MMRQTYVMMDKRYRSQMGDRIGKEKEIASMEIMKPVSPHILR